MKSLQTLHRSKKKLLFSIHITSQPSSIPSLVPSRIPKIQPRHLQLRRQILLLPPLLHRTPPHLLPRRRSLPDVLIRPPILLRSTNPHTKRLMHTPIKLLFARTKTRSHQFLEPRIFHLLSELVAFGAGVEGGDEAIDEVQVSCHVSGGVPFDAADVGAAATGGCSLGKWRIW